MLRPQGTETLRILAVACNPDSSEVGRSSGRPLGTSGWFLSQSLVGRRGEGAIRKLTSGGLVALHSDTATSGQLEL